MHLKNVTLFNFKNYTQRTFEFDKGINCIVGDNGSGKTNLLDAIYFLCLTKSAFQGSDQLIIREGETQASVKGAFLNESGTENVLCKLKSNARKMISLDGKEYEKYSDHIGRFTSILIHPHDVDYVRMASDLRRKLFDGILSQTDHAYLEDFLLYNRIIKQRNAALKSMKEGRYRDEALIDSYDNEIVGLGPRLVRKREAVIQTITPFFHEMHRSLCDDKEEVSLLYTPSVAAEDFPSGFTDRRNRDLEAGRTTRGPHRDDFLFLINGKELKNYGSQGQQKSYMLALKLSFLKLLEGKPLLLLDDIFDRLDTGRIYQLMELINELGLQSFITDARSDRIEHLLAELDMKAKTLYI